MHEQKELSLTCPYCWTRISMLADPSGDAQAYVEDCERCCNPIFIAYQVSDGEIQIMEVEKAN